MPTSRSYHAYLIESLKDCREAAAYIDAVLEDCDAEELQFALKNVAEAQVEVLKANLRDPYSGSQQERAYQLLVQQSNLDWTTLLKLLDELGFKLSVTPKDHVA